MTTRLHLFLAALAATLMPVAARACDMCALYTVRIAEGEAPRGYYLSVQHQSTRLGSFHAGGRRLSNPYDERILSHLTQLTLTLPQSRETAWQVSLPLVQRHFRRVNGTQLETGWERGVGDLRLAASRRLLDMRRTSTADQTLKSETTVRWTTGLRLPTGATSRMSEVTALPSPLLTAPSRGASHGGHTTSGARVAGLDLSPGEGSWGLFLGPDLTWRAGRGFLGAQTLWTVNTHGAGGLGGYEAFQWRLQGGRYLSVRHHGSTKWHLALSGERALGFRGLSLEPGVAWTMGTQASAELAVELPLDRRTSAVQLVPDSRIKAGLSWRF